MVKIILKLMTMITKRNESIHITVDNFDDFYMFMIHMFHIS
jgi:hypothetical protein